MKLHYADPSPGASGYGWATCNAELKKALVPLCHVVDWAIHSWTNYNNQTGEVSAHGSEQVDVCFMPVDSAFRPLSQARGKVNLCYNFFESPLEPEAVENAAKFDTVFVGSTWCQRKCAEAGIHNTEVLIQGVDPAIFHPSPPRQPDGQIRIFSGGKFEYRKGQDLVIAAFREFLKSHPTAHLVCSWFNPWPGLIEDMIQKYTPYVYGNFDLVRKGAWTQESFWAYVLSQEEGIPPENFTILPRLTHEQLAAEMRNTDFGVFPNRCEGGTNLVLMEYLACGRMAAANKLTGHADIGNFLAAYAATEDDNGWAVQSVDDIVGAMNVLAYLQGSPTEHIAPSFSWADAARKVIDAAERAMHKKV